MSMIISTSRNSVKKFQQFNLNNEKIPSVVDRVWNDTTNAIVMSRGWMSHYKINSAIIEMKLDNTYLHNKGGLDFGVGVLYHVNEYNICVEGVPATEKYAAKIIVNER